MRLRSLRLVNYRRFRDATVEFPDGLIAIVGPNGSGKSTLLESIAWCLFGHEAARTKKELLKREGCPPGEDVVVHLQFELDGHAFSVQRRLRGRSEQTEAQLEIDGALVVAPGTNSAEAVTVHLGRSLGMDRRGFLSTVLARQGELSALSQAVPSERKRLVLDLLGIQRVDEAIARCRQEKRESSIRLEEARPRLRRGEEGLQRLHLVEKDLAAAQGEAVAAATEASQAAAQLQLAAQEFHALDEVRQRHRELRTRLEGLQRTLQAREEARTRLQAEVRLLEDHAVEAQQVEAQLGAFADVDVALQRLEAARAAQAAVDAWQAEWKQARAAVDRWSPLAVQNGVHGVDQGALESLIHQLRHGSDALAEEAAKREATASNLDQEARRVQQESAVEATRWREVQELGSHAPCPLCGRVLGDVVIRLTHEAADVQTRSRERVALLISEASKARQESLRLRAEKEEARRALAAEETRLAAVRRRLDETALAQRELAQAQQALERLERERPPSPPVLDVAALERRRAERDRLRQDLARRQAEAQRLDRMRTEWEVCVATVQEVRAQIQEASRELSTLVYREEDWAKARGEEQRLRPKAAEAERRAAVLEERLRNLEAQRLQLEGLRKSVEEDRALVASLEEEVRLGDLLTGDRGDAGLLPEFRNHLIARTRPALAAAASGLISQMTNGRYTELALEEDYGLRLYDGARSWPMERFSGGETDVVHLAVRLAISELLVQARRASRLHFVALDEVLASQDENRRRAVVESLDALSHHFRQVLLVTHLDEVRERVDHVLRVEPGGDGTSRVAWVGADNL